MLNSDLNEIQPVKKLSLMPIYYWQCSDAFISSAIMLSFVSISGLKMN